MSNNETEVIETTAALDLDQFSLPFQKACAVAYTLNVVPHLVQSLRESGYENINESLVGFVGADCAALWGINNPHRTRCFHCGRKSVAGTLCECLEAALPRDFVDLNDAGMVASAPEKYPARTFLCSCCGQLSATTCGEVAQSQRRIGVFYPRKLCGRCFGQQRRAKDAERKARAQERARQKAPLSAPLVDHLLRRAEEVSAPTASA